MECELEARPFGETAFLLRKRAEEFFGFDKRHNYALMSLSWAVCQIDMPMRQRLQIQYEEDLLVQEAQWEKQKADFEEGLGEWAEGGGPY